MLRELRKVRTIPHILQVIRIGEQIGERRGENREVNGRVRNGFGDTDAIAVVDRPAVAVCRFTFRFHRELLGSGITKCLCCVFHIGLHFLVLGDFTLDGLKDCAFRGCLDDQGADGLLLAETVAPAQRLIEVLKRVGQADECDVVTVLEIEAIAKDASL